MQHITLRRNMLLKKCCNTDIISIEISRNQIKNNTFELLRIMLTETHKASVTFGYTLLISAIIYFQIEEEISLPMACMVMSAIIMLILSKYVEYRQQAPYNVVMTITIALSGYLLYSIMPLLRKPETILIVLHSALGLFGLWVSFLMIKGIKKSRKPA